MKKAHLIKIMSILCIIILIASRTYVLASNELVRRFILTSEEQVYIEALRASPIIIAYSYDLAHSEFDGEQYGILKPILDVLTNEFELTVNLKKVNWHDAFIQVENGEVDFYGPIAISESRTQKYIIVEPFYRSYSKIITRTDSPIHSMLGLYNRSIGLLEGSVISEIMQSYLGPYGETVYFPSMEAMTEGLQNGTIDAFATADNAEFELLHHNDIQFEFSIENSYVDQGLISGNENMRMLASILSRYINEYPQISNQIDYIRHKSLLHFSKERFADEIAYLKTNYDEVTMYADSTFYPLCYQENGVIKGMQLEINNVFEELTDVRVRFMTDKDYPEGIATAIEKIKTGECMAFVGGYYDVDTWEDPDIQYSPMLWLDTIRTYSYKDTTGSLVGKTLGSTRFTSDYLGWSNINGNRPLIYNSHRGLVNALKQNEVDAIFMGEMRFNYSYTILKDYNLREVSGVSAEATMHMLYGTQNHEINTIFNESIILFQILNPRSIGQWKAQSNKYKSDYIRMRHTQQMLMTIAIIVFFIMLAILIYLLERVNHSLSETEKYNHDLLDKIHYDATTGIYNRRYLEENLKRIVKSVSRSDGTLSLIMIDVDFFKKFNDTYGHIMGDICLKSIASALAKSITRSYDFVARYGGEEFVVVLPNTDEDGARMIANRLLENVRNCNIPHEKNSASKFVTISIGCTTGKAEYTQNGVEFINRADEALYLSKQNGRNQYTFKGLYE